jgi:hypothetical protein
VGPGTFTVSGTYTQLPSGELATQLAGPNPGQYGVLDAASATLAGKLEILLDDPATYTPSLGDSFDVLTAAINGQFDTVTRPSLLEENPPLAWYVDYEATVVNLEAVLAGDIGLPGPDGFVGAYDFLQFSLCFHHSDPKPPECVNADFNCDNQVDMKDFAVLQRQYGSSAP